MVSGETAEVEKATDDVIAQISIEGITNCSNPKTSCSVRAFGVCSNFPPIKLLIIILQVCTLYIKIKKYSRLFIPQQFNQRLRESRSRCYVSKQSSRRDQNENLQS
jgi:hypothetical protein